MRFENTKKYYQLSITDDIINNFLDYINKNDKKILSYLDKIDKPRLIKLYQFLNLMRNNDGFNDSLKHILVSPTLIMRNDINKNYRHIHGLFEYFIYKNDILPDYNMYLRTYQSYHNFSLPYYNIFIDDEF
jgi:hypothetical protein